MKIQEHCDICNGVDYSILFKERWGYGYDIIQCCGCGVVSISPKMSLSELVRFYNSKENIQDTIPSKDLTRALKKIERFGSRIGQSVLKAKGYNNNHSSKNGYSTLLGQFLKTVTFKEIPDFHNAGVILDIGCNNGLFLYMLKHIGWEVRGSDINSRACHLARELGVECYEGELTDAGYPDKFFDVVRLHHVIEHVHSPKELLSEIRRIIKDNGCLYVAFPNQRSFGFYALKHIWQGRGSLDHLPKVSFGSGGHLYTFSPATFRKLCEQSGFTVEQMKIKSSAGALTNNIFIWSQYKNKWVRTILAALYRKKIFKVIVITPFASLLSLLGFGDICEVKLTIASGNSKQTPCHRKRTAEVASF